MFSSPGLVVCVFGQCGRDRLVRSARAGGSPGQVRVTRSR